MGKKVSIININEDGLNYGLECVVRYEEALFYLNGGDSGWYEVEQMMDDDIREHLHLELAPCEMEEFLAAYLESDPSFINYLTDVEVGYTYDDPEGTWKITKIEDETELETVQKSMLELFERTLKNCRFYKEEGDTARLLNEIGVLRGIAYCMEEVDLCPHSDEFSMWIGMQQQIIENGNVGNVG